VRRLITAIALALASPTLADATLHDAVGHVTGIARTDPNHVTHFLTTAPSAPQARRGPTATA
jgi:hypothetical protein